MSLLITKSKKKFSFAGSNLFISLELKNNPGVYPGLFIEIK